MTDTLLPAAPQPLEKEDDGYFRKVGGFGWAGILRAPDFFPPRLWRGLRGARPGSTRPGGGGGALAWGAPGGGSEWRGAAAVHPAAESR